MILAINTSTHQFALALLQEDGTVVVEHVMARGGMHFGGLMPTLHFLLTSVNLSLGDVKCIVTAIGPGSFTGLRVGISLGKGLCHALNVPLIGIPSLEALASQLPYLALPIIPVLDSRKGELFAARFMWTPNHHLIRNEPDMTLKLADFATVFAEPACFIGNDFKGQGPLIAKQLGDRALLAPAHCWDLRASAVGALGLKRYHAQDFDDPQGLSPLYLRPPDIRPNPFHTASR